jgi:sugar phosphate isomerase/epimerase
MTMIGFTTRTFRPCITRGDVSLGDIVRWAAGERFALVEVRDGNISLSDKELGDLKTTAESAGLPLHYAWDGTNILDPEDATLFQRGVANGARFGPGTFIRITIAGRVIRDSETARGYSRAELPMLTTGIQRYIEIAARRGVRLVFENSHEPLTAASRGETGIRELLAAVPGMEMTFDPGNFMDRKVNRSYSGAAEVKRFYRENERRIPYVHVKMTRNNTVEPTLVEDGDLDPGFFRGILADGKLLCIELPEVDDAETGKRRILDSRRILGTA